MRVFQTFLFATMFSAASGAAAQDPGSTSSCAPEFVDSSVTVSVSGIRVGAGERARENFGVRVRNDGTGDCAAFLRIARRNSTELTDPVEFTFRSEGRPLEVLRLESTPGSTGSDLLVRGIPGAGRGRNVAFQLGFPTEWGIQSGVFSSEYVMTLHDRTGALLDTLDLSVTVDIPPSVALRIVGATGTGRVRRINLGTLDPAAANRSDPFGLRIWSTSPYRVEFVSENQGSLRHDQGRDTIPYILRMRGRDVDLRSANSREFVRHTEALGDFHPLRIVVEPFFAEAGNYSDRVQVSVTAI